ncbi:hypothetical protein [Frankia nepalensis]|uniref:hypothetical protein n=1 Tax=Frankia nepalensis TaxID=1836974 RepID=UPI00396AAE6F
MVLIITIGTVVGTVGVCIASWPISIIGAAVVVVGGGAPPPPGGPGRLPARPRPRPRRRRPRRPDRHPRSSYHQDGAHCGHRPAAIPRGLPPGRAPAPPGPARWPPRPVPPVRDRRPVADGRTADTKRTRLPASEAGSFRGRSTLGRPATERAGSGPRVVT